MEAPLLVPMDRALQLDAEFDRFLEENPHVFRQFRMICCKLKAKGHDRWGAKAIWEILRYQMALETNAPAGGPRLNNNMVSRMARKVMEEEDFAGFFELRSLKGGEPD
jgi:hypothetical protein